MQQISTITMESVTLFFILLVIYSNWRTPDKTRKNLWLQYVLELLFMVILFDLLGWALDGQQGQMARILARTGNFLYYLTLPLCFILYALYLGTGTDGKSLLKGRSCIPFFMIVGLSCVQILVDILNLRTHLLYSIDGSNLFQWGPCALLPSTLQVLQLILMVVEVVLLPASLRVGRDVVMRLSVYILLPIIGYVIDCFYLDLATMHSALVFSIYLIYVDIHMEAQRKILERNLQLSRSQVEHLTWQIHPHFIFNSLMAIKELCEVDGEMAGQAVQEFADYLRGNLDAMSSSDLIPFERELKNIQHYLALEAVDPSWNIQVEYDLEEMDFELPALSVEPLVENAVRHGIGHRAQGGRILIRSWEDAEEIRVSVEDDGVGFQKDTAHQKKRKSLGLQNVRDRLESQCGGTLQIETSDKGSRVTIRIPKVDR